MIWGCMTSKGTGYICWVQGRMNTDFYLTILEDELLQTIDYYKFEREKVIFQQDGTCPHTSPRVYKWLGAHKIGVLSWPAQSPDLNLIEHLWDHLKRQLAKYKKEPEGVNELWERVEKEWNDIPVDVYQNLIDSIERHVKAVRRVKGGYTKYQ